MKKLTASPSFPTRMSGSSIIEFIRICDGWCDTLLGSRDCKVTMCRPSVHYRVNIPSTQGLRRGGRFLPLQHPCS
jgi:hypothetical protein